MKGAKFNNCLKQQASNLFGVFLFPSSSSRSCLHTSHSSQVPKVLISRYFSLQLIASVVDVSTSVITLCRKGLRAQHLAIYRRLKIQGRMRIGWGVALELKLEKRHDDGGQAQAQAQRQPSAQQAGEARVQCSAVQSVQRSPKSAILRFFSCWSAPAAAASCLPCPHTVIKKVLTCRYAAVIIVLITYVAIKALPPCSLPCLLLPHPPEQRSRCIKSNQWNPLQAQKRLTTVYYQDYVEPQIHTAHAHQIVYASSRS